MPSRMTAAARREQLLRSATATFGRLGYENTRLDDIAATARVAKSLLFRYWTSKEELFGELRERLRSESREEVVAAALRPGGAEERIGVMVDAAVGWHLANPHAMAVLRPVPGLDGDADPLLAHAVEDVAGLEVAPEAAPLVAVAVAAMTGAVNGAVAAMHEHGTNPVIVKVALKVYLCGALDALFGLAGYSLDDPRLFDRTSGGASQPRHRG